MLLGDFSMEKIEIYFLLFMIYACLGWIIEVICKLIGEKHFINRGFLIGPYLPIYGWGALSITIMLTKYEDDFFTLFVMAVFWCSVLEYITSYLMEKLFKARWWDYSTYPFNVNGRICLTNALLFGAGGFIIIECVNPVLLPFLYGFSPFLLHFLSIFLFIILLIDTIVSCNIIAKFSKTANFVLQDRSEELSCFVKKNTKNMKENVMEEFSSRIQKLKRETNVQLKKLYKNKTVFHRRLIYAFPNVQVRNEKIEKLFYKILKKVRKERD